MSKKNSIAHKILSVVLNVLLIFYSVAPGVNASLVYAQEAPAADTLEVTPSPSPSVEPTPSPIGEPQQSPTPTPKPTVEPTPTPSGEPSPSPFPTPSVEPEPSPAPTPSPSPSSEPSSTDQIENNTSPEPTVGQPNAPPSESPNPSLTSEPSPKGHLSAVILENTDAQSLQLDLTTQDVSSASLTTDKADYAPTDTAVITGSDFPKQADLKLIITADNYRFEDKVTTDENGQFIYTYQLDGIYRPLYKVEAYDLSGTLLATTTFTDAPVSGCTTDSAGANDKPGQKDLTKMCVDYSGLLATLSVSWNWDEINGSGSNTYDACSLYDTNSNGLADYSICVVVNGSPLTQIVDSPRIYSCNDAYSEKCGNKALISGTYSTTCSVSQQNDDPFPAGDESPSDTIASCNITLSEVGGGSSQLTDVCSYPSQEPNSAPSDCIVFKENTGRLEVIKDLIPSSDTGLFNLQINGNTEAANVGDGGTTGEKVLSVTGQSSDYTVGETAGTSTSLSNYSTDIVCRDLNGTGSIVAQASNAGPLTVTLHDNDDIVCTITNALQDGIIIVHKDVQGPSGEDITDSSNNFTVNLDGANLQSITDNGTATYNNVAAGAHTVNESVIPSGYALYSMIPDSDSGTGGAQITVNPGQTTDVYVINRQQNTTLTLTKTVTNDNGGTKVVSDFVLKIDGNTVTSGQSNNVTPGSYTASEINLSGYIASSWGGDCATDGTITLSLGDNKTCTITNDDIQPKLTVTKIVTNDNGGNKVVSDFPLFVGATSVTSGVQNGFNAGTYTVSETSQSGYTGTITGDCAPNGSITLTAGDVKSCTITNNDQPAHVIVIKNVTNNDNGTKTPSDFTMHINGTSVGVGVSFPGVTGLGTNTTVNAGNYTVSEDSVAGYSGSMSGDCSTSIANGETKTCTVSNNDQPAHVIVIKHVVNDNGGNAVASAFTMHINGTSVGTGVSFPGAETPGINTAVKAGSFTVTEDSVTGYSSSTTGDCSGTIANDETKICTITNNDIQPKLTVTKIVTNDHGGTKQVSDFPLFVDQTSVTSGQQNGFNAGTYTVSETQDPGYDAAISGDCAANGSITLNIGDVKSCTITNNDKAAHLIVIKHVVNDNGGSALASAFTMTINNVTASGGNSFAGDESGVNKTLTNVGSYSVTETGPSGYTQSDSADCSGTIALGETKTCTITNDDNVPSLHLRKTITNDNGGTAAVTDWTLTATGTGGSPTNLNGTTPVDSGSNFKADTYALAESGPSGYSAGAWNCVGGNMGDATHVTVVLGESATCTINNDDIAPTLKLVKLVTNDNGGDASASAWALIASGGTDGFTDNGATGSFHTVTAGMGYVLSELGPAGYTAGSWSCDGGSLSGSSVTLSLNQNVTCTITNNDQAGTLIVKKVVVNDNGGALDPEDFSFKINNGNSIVFEADGQNDLTVNAGTYTITEPTVAGYSTSYNNCSNVVIPNGGSATCTITNDDIAPVLNLVKTVTNDNGGSATQNDFNVYINGQPSSWGAHTLSAGSYTVSEDTLSGYTPTSWGDDCAANGTITLNIGDEKTCSIINNDEPGKISGKKFNDLNGDHQRTNTTTDPNLPGWTITLDKQNDINPPVCPGGTIVGELCVTTTNSFGNYAFNGLEPGTYIVSEVLQNGWLQTRPDAIYGGQGHQANGTYILTIGSGTKIDDRDFGNQGRGTITVHKNVDGNGDGDLEDEGVDITNSTDWTWDVDGQGDFDTGDAAQPVAAGNYTISEHHQENYHVVSLICGETNYGETENQQITINPGDKLVCTFTNARDTGSLQVNKEVDRDGDGGFEGGNDEANDLGFRWGIDQETPEHLMGGVANPLPTGTYSVSENDIAGYTFAGWYDNDGEGSCDEPDEETLPESVNISTDNQTSITLCNVRDTGRIIIQKLIDEDGDIQTTDDRAPGADWVMDVDGTGLDTSDPSLPTTDENGEIQTGNIKTGEYTAVEGSKDGYHIVSASCSVGESSRGTFDGTDSVDSIQVGKDETVNCTFINTKNNGTITILKNIDNNGDGDSDNEVDARGATDWTWDIADGEQNIQTGQTKTLPRGFYTITEDQRSSYKFLGWSCSNEQTGTTNSITIDVRNGSETTCTFTNQILPPVLTLTKVNDKTGIDVSAGASVLYTLTVSLTGSPLSNVSVIDLPPAGFKYRSGSWTASSSVRGDLKALGITTEPTYASPGTWLLGNMTGGEVVTLTYIADIDASTDPGLYKDLAWSKGTGLVSSTVLANEATGFFVGTEVNIVKNPDGTAANIEREEVRGEVLGASIAMPSTGANTLWVVLAGLLLIAGIGSIAAGIRLRRKNV